MKHRVKKAFAILLSSAILLSNETHAYFDLGTVNKGDILLQPWQ